MLPVGIGGVLQLSDHYFLACGYIPKDALCRCSVEFSEISSCCVASEKFAFVASFVLVTSVTSLYKCVGFVGRYCVQLLPCAIHLSIAALSTWKPFGNRFQPDQILNKITVFSFLLRGTFKRHVLLAWCSWDFLGSFRFRVLRTFHNIQHCQSWSKFISRQAMTSALKFP